MSKDYAARARDAAAGFFTDTRKAKDTGGTQDTRDTKGTKDIAASNEAATPKGGAPYYRFNLKLSPELGGYLEEESWRLRLSRTELINRILKAYKEEHPHE